MFKALKDKLKGAIKKFTKDVEEASEEVKVEETSSEEPLDEKNKISSDEELEIKEEKEVPSEKEAPSIVEEISEEPEAVEEVEEKIEKEISSEKEASAIVEESIEEIPEEPPVEEKKDAKVEEKLEIEEEIKKEFSEEKEIEEEVEIKEDEELKLEDDEEKKEEGFFGKIKKSIFGEKKEEVPSEEVKKEEEKVEEPIVEEEKLDEPPKVEEKPEHDDQLDEYITDMSAKPSTGVDIHEKEEMIEEKEVEIPDIPSTEPVKVKEVPKKEVVEEPKVIEKEIIEEKEEETKKEEKETPSEKEASAIVEEPIEEVLEEPPAVEEKEEEKIEIKEEISEKKIEEDLPEVKEEPKEEKKGFFSKITDIVTKTSLNEKRFEEIFWELEIVLLENNVAVEVIEKIKQDLKDKLVGQPIKRGQLEEEIIKTLGESIKELFEVEGIDLIKKAEEKNASKEPLVIAFIGVNGSGKTTTIAKIARLFQNYGMKPVIAAADTFRAAAIQQMEEHANNLGVKMIKHDYGADPAAVAFDAIKYAKQKGNEVVLIDTAGRLHSNVNLMDEMKKIIRVSKPDLKIFIGEAITGNDCVEQARQFDEAVGIDGAILCKADVDEKGGAAISVGYVTGKPILYLGVGQGYDDLKEFDKKIVMDTLELET
ncbi:signal recognition particle-docking protein FtsY [Candidatus Woesearchaeota archaeon]|nr:signal recognition particle-docking protein FtsY [Candidatus Woesearchaeota archaeon]